MAKAYLGTPEAAGKASTKGVSANAIRPLRKRNAAPLRCSGVGQHYGEGQESRTGAREAIRALIDTILLEPDGDQLKITLKGDLAGMLSAAKDTKRSSDARRPRGPNKVGCGGSQPSEFGVRLGGSLSSKSYAFQACAIDHSAISPL